MARIQLKSLFVLSNQRLMQTLFGRRIPYPIKLTSLSIRTFSAEQEKEVRQGALESEEKKEQTEEIQKEKGEKYSNSDPPKFSKLQFLFRGIFGNLILLGFLLYICPKKKVIRSQEKFMEYLQKDNILEIYVYYIFNLFIVKAMARDKKIRFSFTVNNIDEFKNTIKKYCKNVNVRYIHDKKE